MYYKLIIDETGADSPKNSLEHSTRFNVIEESFYSLDDLKEYLVDRYGKMPSKKRKIYIDTKDGVSKEVGFLHSFWNKDISHDSKNWYQTDWICITSVEETPVLLS